MDEILRYKRAVIVVIIIIAAIIIGILFYSLTLVPPPPYEEKDAIKVGFSMPLSGKYAKTGQYALAGIKLWAEDVNRKEAIE